jgi:signal transduction histidine kinase
METVHFDSGVRQPRFFWRGVLILLPVALLAGVGIYSLRQDRVLAEIEAKERCQSLAENVARAVVAELQLPSPRPFSEITLDAGGHLAAIGGSPSRAKMMENLVPHPIWESNLMLARYSLALQCAASNKSAADDLWREVAQDRDATSESGLPLFLLADYQRWKLGGARRELAETLCSNALEFPTLISPMLLAAANDPKWLEAWQRDEAARAFYQMAQPALTHNTWKRGGLWVRWQQDDWLVLSSSKSLTVVPFQFVDSAAAWVPIFQHDRVPYAQPVVAVAGKRFPDRPSPWPLLATSESNLFSGASVTVSEYLAIPELLYARARTRTEWFAALIVVAAAAALIGFVSAYRGFHQQIRLSEMKSNFVSSVSHELRAPIASMRLLAESLERGKISDATKQKQYFGLLVQESRRLAMLIENILDFSRIERGSKKYEFEPANIARLAEDTVQLMRPCAAERQVDLDVAGTPRCGVQSAQRADPALLAEVESFSCDSLALQQALINLIDNAVKHSLPGGRVAIGVDGGAAGLSLWVEDHGQGIPPEEQRRIFERFYRRGSELRRETQGIGIGLTIVKHIVEAHGGRVTVRSAPGQGSRFTMELPRR